MNMVYQPRSITPQPAYISNRRQITRSFDLGHKKSLPKISYGNSPSQSPFRQRHIFQLGKPKNSTFTKGFNNFMFRDTRLGTDYEKKRRNIVIMNHQMEKTKEFRSRMEQSIKKQAILKRYLKDNQIFTTVKEVESCNALRLSINLKKRHIQYKERTAATLIQNTWKRYSCIQKFKKCIQLREKAVRKIQRTWKSYKFLRILPLLRFKQKQDSALLIQRFIKGNTEYWKYKKQLLQKRIISIDRYFSAQKLQLSTEAQILIASHWKRFKAQQLKLVLQNKIKEKIIRRNQIAQERRDSQFQAEEIVQQVPSSQRKRRGTVLINNLGVRTFKPQRPTILHSGKIERPSFNRKLVQKSVLPKNILENSHKSLKESIPPQITGDMIQRTTTFEQNPLNNVKRQFKNRMFAESFMDNYTESRLLDTPEPIQETNSVFDSRTDDDDDDSLRIHSGVVVNY